MLGGVTRHVLPHLPGVHHLHVNRLLSTSSLVSSVLLIKITRVQLQYILNLARRYFKYTEWITNRELGL